MRRELVIVGAYLIALIVVGWIGYWWFVGFALLSPMAWLVGADCGFDHIDLDFDVEALD